MIALTALIVLQILSSNGIFGCSCYYPSDEALFCADDVALKAKVLSEKKIYDRGFYLYPLKVVYTVEVEEVFRKPENENLSGKLEVETAGDGGLCGVSLSKNTDYLLTGSINGPNTMRIGLCGMNRAFDRLTEAQMYGIRSGYRCNNV